MHGWSHVELGLGVSWASRISPPGDTQIVPDPKTLLETSPSAVATPVPWVGGGCHHGGGQSCRGCSQRCSHSKAEGHFSGQWEGALVLEMLLREAISLATSLAPVTSRPLLNPEGWEAGGGGEKPSQVAFYWVIYRLSQILEKKPISKLTVLQSKTSRCAQEPCGRLQAPSRQGSGGGKASSFPQRARTGGHDTCGCPELVFLFQQEPPVLQEEEISRSGSSGSDGKV